MVSLAALLSLLQAPAAAGYGDAVDGYPSWAERELHLYTNAARVAPLTFEAEYQQGGCSSDDFTASERSPKDPLYYSAPLNEAARYHSEDMLSSGNFSHDSSDGTSFADRLAAFYPESPTVGENIAAGYPDNWVVLFQGWMCSSGHRENIMRAAWEELGTGVADRYYTQHFGGGAPDSGGGVRMGVHTPQRPAAGEQVTLYADWAGDAAPELAAVVDGVPYPMSLEWGEADRGVYRADVTLPGDCVDYYFSYEGAAGEGSFPEEGAYLMGPSCTAEWTERGGTIYPGDAIDTGGALGAEDIAIKGCSTAPGGGLPALLIPALLGLALRRREAAPPPG